MRSKRRLRILSVLLMVLILIGGGIWQILRQSEPPYTGVRWQRDQEERVQEAVFRYQIAENCRNGQVCFLSVKEAAPDRALMQRFAPLAFVQPVSPRFQSDKGDYRDRTTGTPALHFWIDKTEWLTDTEVYVEGGGGAANKSGNAGEFKVLWQHGKWQVESYTPRATF